MVVDIIRVNTSRITLLINGQEFNLQSQLIFDIIRSSTMVDASPI